MSMLWGSIVFSALFGATPQLTFHIPYEKYTLPQNGLEVILSEDHSLPIVAVNVWYHAGPVNEPPGRTGFAHLFEHLMFQGSKHVGDDMHIKLLDSRGASLINGTTSFDRTNYFETVPANEIELALWLESDRMGFLLETLDQKKLENQREVVMNERRQHYDNAPYGPSREKLMQTLLDANHPYFGNVIGSMKDLQSATLDDVRDFYNKYYAPANATLVICGDFDLRRIKALVERYFATLPRRDAPQVHSSPQASLQEERISEVHEHVSLPQLMIAYPSPPAFMPGDADADVLAVILGQGKASRLYQKLVYEQQLALDVSVYQQSSALTSWITFEIMAAKPNTDMIALQAEVQRVIDNISIHPPTSQEISRARNILQTDMVSGLQTIGGFGGKADTLNRYNQYLGNPGYFQQDLLRYQAVTPDTVQKLAYNLFHSNHRAVVRTVPQS